MANIGEPLRRHTVIPPNGANHGTGGAAPGGIATFVTSGTFVSKFRPGAVAFTSTDIADAANDYTYTRAFTEPKPPTIPNAGIRTGEIIGHRLWWVIGDDLCSLAHSRIWKPGETIVGDTNGIVRSDPFYFEVIWGGTYAFATRGQLGGDIEAMTDALASAAQRRRSGSLYLWAGHPLYVAEGFAIGTVKMWGDVVEHETGYRAEFAKLNSIDEIHHGGDLDALRAKYLPR